MKQVVEVEVEDRGLVGGHRGGHYGRHWRAGRAWGLDDGPGECTEEGDKLGPSVRQLSLEDGDFRGERGDCAGEVEEAVSDVPVEGDLVDGQAITAVVVHARSGVVGSCAHFGVGRRRNFGWPTCLWRRRRLRLGGQASRR